MKYLNFSDALQDPKALKISFAEKITLLLNELFISFIYFYFIFSRKYERRSKYSDSEVRISPFNYIQMFKLIWMLKFKGWFKINQITDKYFIVCTNTYFTPKWTVFLKSFEMLKFNRFCLFKKLIQNNGEIHLVTAITFGLSVSCFFEGPQSSIAVLICVWWDFLGWETYKFVL